MIDFVKNLDYSHLSKPFIRTYLHEELQINNKVVYDMVELWVEIRRRRLQFE